MKTQYRKIHCGVWFWLQYLEIKKGWFRTKKRWKFIWRPHCDEITGTRFGLEDVYYYGFPSRTAYVCQYNTDIDEFIKKWPNINDYFEWAEKEQEILEIPYKKRISQHNRVRGTIEYYK